MTPAGMVGSVTTRAASIIIIGSVIKTDMLIKLNNRLVRNKSGASVRPGGGLHDRDLQPPKDT